MTGGNVRASGKKDEKNFQKKSKIMNEREKID
jgi:hypothetical protein